jgi:hypothetical protein
METASIGVTLSELRSERLLRARGGTFESNESECIALRRATSYEISFNPGPPVSGHQPP